RHEIYTLSLHDALPIYAKTRIFIIGVSRMERNRNSQIEAAASATMMISVAPCFRSPNFIFEAMKNFLRFFSALFAFSAVILSAFAAEPATIALKAARLFDGKSKALVANGVVIIEGDKIVDAGSNLPIPQGAEIIDLGDATLSPGFMDA